MFRMNWLTAIAGAVLAAVLAGAMTSGATAKDIVLSFYYPVAVGGPIPKIIDGYAADFEKENPGIVINAI
jgi:sn-glycerol 3-phosphate transport system substrate-binding protein